MAANRGKPHPDMFLQAAEHIQVEPAACLVLEDAPAGIQAALPGRPSTQLALLGCAQLLVRTCLDVVCRGAGMAVAAIRNPHVNAERYSQPSPDQLVDSWLDLEFARWGIPELQAAS